MSGLEKLQRNLEKLDGEHQLKLTELVTDDFARKNTNFQSAQAFLDASGIKSEEGIGTEALDAFIAANTRFESWEEMMQAAGSDWAIRQLEL